MGSSYWQKQHGRLREVVWALSAVISVLLFVLLSSLGLRMETAGVIFIAVFILLRVVLAFILKNRFANTMVRVLKFDYEELERDFRIVFKNNYIRFYGRSEEDAYSYEFPGYRPIMTVQPHWLSYDNAQPATKVTLGVLDAKNEAFAMKLAKAIDEMADQRPGVGNAPDRSRA